MERICGMESLRDLGSTEESAYDATDALRAISSNVCVRDPWTDGRLRRLVKWHRNAAERNCVFDAEKC